MTINIYQRHLIEPVWKNIFDRVKIFPRCLETDLFAVMSFYVFSNFEKSPNKLQLFPTESYRIRL